MLKLVLLFISSTIIASILTSLVSTQIVLADIQSFGINISLIDRYDATMNDLLGFTPILFIFIAPGFLIGFTIAKYLHLSVGGNRIFWYLLSGSTSFPITLYIVKYFMGVTVIASARTTVGLLLVTSCCIFASWIFAIVSSNITKGAHNDK